MIRNPLLAGRYARALYEASEGKADLAPVEAAIKGRELDLKRPRLTLSELETLSGRPDHPQVRAMLGILLRRKRQGLLPEIAEMYRIISEEAKGIRRAQVTTAVPLTPAMERKIRETVAEHLQAKEVILEATVDPAIIGGLRLKCGDDLIDATVVSTLEEFRSKF